jgi:protein-tyrosine phosphatase
LGVPKDEVMADFLKSNDYILPHYAKEIEEFVKAGGEREIIEAILGVKPEYLEAAFDEMEKSFGSIEAYFETGLGIDAKGQEALRALYLASE